MLLLAVIALGVPLAISLRDRVDAEVRSQAQSQADVVAASASELLETGSRRTLNKLARQSAASVRGRVIVVDGAGRIVADSAGPAELGARYSNRPEIAAALAGRSYQEVRHSDTLDADILATAVPVIFAGRPIGAVRVTQSVEAVNHAVRRSLVGIALLGLVVLLLGVTAGALIAGQIARPIRRLAGAADRVAAGDLETRAAIEGTTEQRSLARSFNEMTARLERLLQGHRDFVADASHQLRTPLTGVRLHLEELQAGSDSAEQQPALLDAAIHEIDRLAAIVDELLILSRAGEHDLPGEEIGLADAADRAAGRWRRAGEAKQVEIVRRSSDGPSIVLCASGDLDRALDSLIENAILYSPRGEEIAIVDGPGSIEVLDRGPGLAEGEEKVVFERFFRGRAGRQGPEGTGLGLAIASELASQWGGTVSIANRSGGGARAALTLVEAKGIDGRGAGADTVGVG